MRLTVAKIIGTCFGAGYFPWAPGTFTSLLAVLPCIFFPGMLDPKVMCGLVAVACAAGVWAGTVMEEHFGEDPSIVTIDELAGQWLALAAVPYGVVPFTLSFLFFRLFDILKPGPIDALQRLPGGWGIMADDLLAGILANIAARCVLALLMLLHLPSGI
ncbi:MAG: phosphatidylglycerophosphatase A [Chlorobiaceae bacterium]|nr:phosphatidylglycerophosphatase A [Chlorobiaceae bacterium]